MKFIQVFKLYRVNCIFVNLEVEKADILAKYERSEKTDAANHLELEKHRLRQAKGKLFRKTTSV